MYVPKIISAASCSLCFLISVPASRFVCPVADSWYLCAAVEKVVCPLFAASIGPSIEHDKATAQPYQESSPQPSLALSGLAHVFQHSGSYSGFRITASWTIRVFGLKGIRIEALNLRLQSFFDAHSYTAKATQTHSRQNLWWRWVCNSTTYDCMARRYSNRLLEH